MSAGEGEGEGEEERKWADLTTSRNRPDLPKIQGLFQKEEEGLHHH